MFCRYSMVISGQLLIFTIMEKYLPGFDNKYCVSYEGFAYSLKGKRKMLFGKIICGYRQLVLSHKGVKKYLLLHILVAKAFKPNPLSKRTVNHKDCDKLNCHADNLEWATDSENLIHARNSGLLKCKITQEIATLIRNDKGSCRELSKKYGIGKTQIGYIKQGKRWKD